MNERLRGDQPLAWVTGAGGLIGSQLLRLAPELAPTWRTIGLTRDEVELTDAAAVRARFAQDRPQLVVALRCPEPQPDLPGRPGVGPTPERRGHGDAVTTVANAIFLQYTAPIYVVIFGFWFLGERPQRLDWITMAVIFAGMLLFFGEGLTLEGLYGNLAGVLSGVALAITIVSARGHKASHPAQIFLIGSFFGGLIGLPSVLQETWSLTGIAIIGYLGIFQTGLASALYSIAIRQVPALESNLILMLEPVLNPLWVFLAIGESPAPLALLGGAVVLGAIATRAIVGARHTDVEAYVHPFNASISARSSKVGRGLVVSSQRIQSSKGRRSLTGNS